jgi:hypothetical protein
MWERTRLNTAQWRILPVLNVRELDEDDVKCLAFDNCANVDFGRLTEQFGRRGGDYHEVEYLTKAYTEEVADALYSKTGNFNQTKQYTPRLMVIFTPCPPNLA